MAWPRTGKAPRSDKTTKAIQVPKGSVCVCILYRISEQQQPATCVVWSETAPKRQAVNCCPVLAGRTDDSERPHRPLCIRECLT